MAAPKYPKHEEDYSLVVTERTNAEGEKIVEKTQKCRVCGKPKP